MKRLAAFLFILTSLYSSAQQPVRSNTNEGTKNTATPRDRAKFYKFLIPASINGSDIAPAAITSFNVDFGEDEIEFKYGNTFTKTKVEAEKDNPGSKALKNSYFFSAALQAPDGTATLYKYDNSPIEVSFKTGLTFITKNAFYRFTAPASLSGERSTEKFHWVNVIPKISFANLNIFSDDTTYKKNSSTTLSVMTSYNMYFHSRMGVHKWRNSILSAGIGIGRINNYQSLTEITREKGTFYTAPGYVYYSKKEEDVKGRVGPFEELTAGLYNLEAYKSIRRDSVFTCYLGARYFGYFGEEDASNASLGLFFSFSSKNDKGEFEEKFGFAVNGAVKNLQQVSDNKTFRENFAITFSATVPLKFNYDRKPSN